MPLDGGKYPEVPRRKDKIPIEQRFNFAERDRQKNERIDQNKNFWFNQKDSAENQIKEAGKDQVQEVEISALSGSPKNSFHQIREDVYEELRASIKANGLVYPIVIRPKSCIENYVIDGEYEILAGHNRVRAVQELGWDKIKANIVEINDVGAVRIINDSNLQRGDVTELEKAWAYRKLFEAMNRNGKNQYSTSGEADNAENEFEDVEQSSTSCEPQKRTADTIGEMYGLTGRTVRKKIRLTYLLQELYKLYEKKDISQNTALNLSYLDENTQRLLLELRRKYHFDLTDQNSQALRTDYNAWKRSGEEAEYAPQRLLRIMQMPEAVQMPKAAKPKKYTVPDTLFPVTVKPKEREAYVEKVLRYVLENKIDL